MVIASFTGENRYLSNFYIVRNPLYMPNDFISDNLHYNSVEHAYQAAKTIDIIQRAVIAGFKNPADAKAYGYKVEIREDWEYIKRIVMLRLVKQKFQVNPELRTKLINTYPAMLVEGNTWHDNYWGKCLCNTCFFVDNRENWLGRILMHIREGLLING